MHGETSAETYEGVAADRLSKVAHEVIMPDELPTAHSPESTTGLTGINVAEATSTREDEAPIMETLQQVLMEEAAASVKVSSTATQETALVKTPMASKRTGWDKNLGMLNM